jgi:hypothetical protein
LVIGAAMSRMAMIAGAVATTAITSLDCLFVVGPPPVGIYLKLEIRAAAGPSSAVQCVFSGGP